MPPDLLDLQERDPATRAALPHKVASAASNASRGRCEMNFNVC